jgi:hypothetical protein
VYLVELHILCGYVGQESGVRVKRWNERTKEQNIRIWTMKGKKQFTQNLARCKARISVIIFLSKPKLKN